MTTINAHRLSYEELNARIKKSPDPEISVDDVLGQRYIGSGVKNKTISIYGTPGNALGAYLASGTINVFGNAQDAVGDTMNGGELVIHGNAGDTLGYAMRGGDIYVSGNAGFRVGIHMKAYENNVPHIVIGGGAGDFLGEYQAGGIIVILGNDCGAEKVGKFCATGQHGGKIYIRGESELRFLANGVNVNPDSDKTEIIPLVTRYAEHFGANAAELLASRFICLSPTENNPYNKLYKNV